MKVRAAASGLAALLLLSGCEGRVTESTPALPGLDAQLRQALASWSVIPIGAMPVQDTALVALGRALFFDPILSGNRDLACASCHNPASALGDGLSLAVGTGSVGNGMARRPGQDRTFLPRHAPSLLNAGLGPGYFFWDGRLRGHPGSSSNETGVVLPAQLPSQLAALAMLPVLNRQEMRGYAGDRDVFGNANELALFRDTDATDIWKAIVQRLMSIPEYVQMFSLAFPGRHVATFEFADAAHALAVYQRQAFTRTRSPFDRYLDRDDAALTAAQKRGAALFFAEARCGSCHNGPLLGGSVFANVGVPQIGPGVARQLPLDLGRGEVQQNEFYRFAFRVPPLRNVELTAPYMHNGAYPTLEAVLRHYNNVPLALHSYDVSQLAPELRALHHNDEASLQAVMATLDGRLRTPLDLSEAQTSDLIEFLKSLTDPAARNLIVQVPSRVPSGLPVP